MHSGALEIWSRIQPRPSQQRENPHSPLVVVVVATRILAALSVPELGQGTSLLRLAALGNQ